MKIETKKEYEKALKDFEALMNALDEYEVEHFPIDLPSEEAANEFRREQEETRTKKIIDRLTMLINYSENNNEPISYDSISGFFYFWHLDSGLNYPDLTLTPDGNLVAEWGRGFTHLSIEFQTLELAKYSHRLLGISDNFESDISSVGGTEEIAELMEILDKEYGIKSWIMEKL